MSRDVYGGRGSAAAAGLAAGPDLTPRATQKPSPESLRADARREWDRSEDLGRQIERAQARIMRLRIRRRDAIVAAQKNERAADDLDAERWARIEAVARGTDR